MKSGLCVLSSRGIVTWGQEKEERKGQRGDFYRNRYHRHDRNWIKTKIKHTKIHLKWLFSFSSFILLSLYFSFCFVSTPNNLIWAKISLGKNNITEREWKNAWIEKKKNRCSTLKFWQLKTEPNENFHYTGTYNCCSRIVAQNKERGGK